PGRGRGGRMAARRQRRAAAFGDAPRRQRGRCRAPHRSRRSSGSRLRAVRLPQPVDAGTGRGSRHMSGGADVVRSYHSATTHGGDHDRSQLVRFQPLDPTNRPAPFKLYPDYPLVEFDALDPLGRLLFYSLGVTRRSNTSYFRAAMSAGNLHPVEAYVVGDDLSVGHYHPLQHALTTLRPGNGAPMAIVLTGIPWRTAWKYGERGWRHLWWDSGAVAANMVALSDAVRITLDFNDDAVNRLVGADGVSEFALAVVQVGGAELRVPADIDALHVT